ncbi:ATP-binding protein [Azospirillum sp. ST 5-10]|uniref:ATP-binding protein n=1 Tax=unclassified Azospirillum TaxID=2630922 RepID=UPI003F49E30B
MTDEPGAPYHRVRSADGPSARPRTPVPAGLARRLWHDRSLRAQILATFVLINMMACALALVLVVANARRATLVEIDSSVDLAERFVRATLQHLEEASPNGLRLDDLPLRFSHQRHVRIVITAAADRAAPVAVDGAAAPEETAARDGDAPAWFSALVGVEDSGRSIPVLSQGRRIATVTVLGEAADEIAEVWQDTTDLALLAVLVNLAVVAVLYVVLGRVLDPLRGLAAGFHELEQGHFRHRLPRPMTRELSVIVERFNALANSLTCAQADNARLNRRLVAVQDDERRQLAVELHDELGPCLFGLKANVASLSRLADALPPALGGPVRERVDTLMDIGERIQTVNRRLLKTVRPMALGHVPLADAIAGLVAEFERHEPACRFRLDVGRLAPSYGDSIDLTLYRCIQEGLTNAVRHAGARGIAVALTEDGMPARGDGPGGRAAAIRLSVEDDGRGMAPDTPAGLGLTGMRERVTALGGTIAMTARPGGGTRLAVAIPLDDGDRPPPSSALPQEPNP